MAFLDVAMREQRTQSPVYDFRDEERTSASQFPPVPHFSDEDVPPAPLDHSSPRYEIGIRIEPVALVTQECITLTSAMRKHARWAQSSVSAILGGSVQPTSLQVPEQTVPRPNSSRGSTPRIDPVGGKSTIGPTVSDDESTLASRWGLRTKKVKPVQDNPLLSAFAKLRRDLANCRDVSKFDAPALLHPFLQVIRSSSTSATITSLAVMSITKFLNYNLITIHSPRIAPAMHLLSAAITHCRFEASDTAADEVVLLRILRLMELAISRPEGLLLGDESVCEMMSTGLSMCCQTRLSEVLRRSAEMAMVTMCQIVFGRLAELKIEDPPVQPSGRSRSNTTRSMVPPVDEMKIQPPLMGSVMGNGREPRPSTDNRASYESNQEISGGEGQASAEKDAPRQAQIEEDDESTPYALPSIRELFRVLIDLLDPHNRQHTNAMRIMALRILDVALEVAGPFIAAQPTLAVLVEDDLCRHLFQLVRSEDMVLLNSSLRVAGTLLTTCRKLLKLQQELYLSYLIACLHIKVEIPLEPGIDSALYEGVPQAPKLVKPAPSQPSSGRATPVPVKDRRQLGLEGGQRRPEAREAMVEAIGTLIRMPVFMAELFVNYDCDVDRQDLCEDMVGLLARNAFPDAATWSTTNVPPLCLDSLLTFIQFLTDGISQAQPEDAAERIAQLRRQRRRKKIIKSGSTKFNDNPKGGVAFLVSNGIIDNPDDPVQLAKFLKSTTHLSKKVLGDFITKKTNEELLKAFIGLFDFDGKRIDEALRELLTSFRLPGESALIERIVNVFVEKFLNSSISDSIADQDAGFVLTYAIIMLNTDLYNPNVKKSQKRMTVEDFARNLRGVNAGKDFDQDYLQDIYDAINQNEIILPEEHDNKNAFDHAWKTMLLNTQNAGQLELCNTNAFDAEMFSATWKPIVATLCYVFMSATDDAVYSRVVSGFDQCAQLAAKYGATEAFDRIIYSLSQISGLATEIPLSTSLNTEVQVGKKKVMVSELAVRLGRDYRAQLSTIVLLRSLQGFEIAVGETWVYVVRILRNLFVNALITMPVQSDNKLSDLGPIPLQPPAKVIDKDGKLAETGIFSTFTSYLSSYAADEPPEPSEEELENTLSSVDCVAACRVEDLLTNLLTLPSEQLEKLVNALLSEMPDAPSPVVVVKPDVRPAPVTARVNGTRTAKHGPDYDAGAVFLLELATRLVLRDNDTIATAGEALTNALQSAVRNASNIHPLAASRIVQYLLELLRHSFEHDFMRAPVVLHAISSFNDMLLDQTATAVVKGLTLCVGQPGPLRADAIASPDFWSILQRLHQHKTEADNVLAILEKLTEDSSPTQSSSPTFRGITPDSYTPALTLATSFATAASMPGSIIEQRRDLAHRRGQKPRPPRPEDAAIVQRALKAITVLYALGGLAPQLIKQSALERGEAWKEYWGAIFRGLAGVDGIAMSACREVRNRGVSVLLRILLSDDLVQPEDLNTSEQVESDEVEDDDKSKSTTQQVNNEWTAIFSEVLFPLVARLLKPEVHKADPVGMGETRVVMVTVLCKAFLKYFDQLAKIPSRTIESAPSTQDGPDTTDEKPSAQQSRTKQEFVLVRAWAGTLELLDRLMNASVGTKEGEALEEAVAEGVKNVLLVLGDAGLLVRAGDSNLKVHDDEDEMQAQLWRETKHRVEVLLPGLMEEIFPEPKASSMPLPASAPVPDGAAGDEKGTMA
ncbi:GDP/GTP exchange factor for ARF [Lithohypha guttulata]|uniref:GDP/GTP exchange factor for ARF n=1 Tax=Lithohypha guttulata TaxID=1690604 RepID=A0AAN7SZR6_9EURO|nr:GDP/GTP exchange factor for ARF [Lithohypha guttulata]KAK5085519.1 GDP/GTP exchange factor for ARF [Lithohypha guttulata]